MIAQSVVMAWESVTSNKMRSFLTMLGIIIGIVALIVMVSLVEGATSVVTSEISSLGSDLINVVIRDDKGYPVRLSDLKIITQLEGISKVAPTSTNALLVKYKYFDINASIIGTTPDYFSMQKLTISQGRLIKTPDVENGAYITVLSSDAAIRLFGGEYAVGKKVIISGKVFQVVGVLEKSKSVMSALSGDYSIYVPYSVAARMMGQQHITSFVVSSNNDTKEAERAITHYLMNRFSNDDKAFTVINMSNISETMESVTGMLSLLLGGIAAISLLVGGIGIMNIMLVSVTERTKEIGIRKAIGAERGMILIQFLIESMLLSLFGCLFGIVISGILLGILSSIARVVRFQMTISVIMLAVVFSSGIGIIFGLYPANKAAKLPPIEALRFEG